MSGKETTKQELDERVGEALGSWPMPDRGEGAWENLAVRIEGRIARMTKGSLDSEGPGGPDLERLLEPPLPATPSEVQESAPPGTRTSGASGISTDMNSGSFSRIAAGPGDEKMSSQPPERDRERERERRSLKDLAKLASAPSLTPNPPPSKAQAASSSVKPPPSVSVSPLATTHRKDAGDSGIVDLKMMAQVDPEASERAKKTKLASAELFDDEPHSGEPAAAKSSVKSASAAPASSKTPAAAPASAGKTPASAPASTSSDLAGSTTLASATAPAAVSARPAPKAKDKEEKSSAVVWIAGIGGLCAAAAAAVFMLQSQPSSAPAAAAPPTPPPAVTAAAPESKPAAPPAATVAAAETPAAADTDNGVDPSSLPLAGSVHPTHGAVTTHAVAPGPQKSVTVAGKADTVPAEPKPDLVAKVPTGAGMGAATDLEKELQRAAGPTDAVPAAGGGDTPANKAGAGDVPQKPSAGAVASGMHEAMSSARACLGLDDPISRAAVSFDSSGSVTSVVVSGFAAGKPAEACIKNSLGKAKLPPFAQPSFTQTFTIRPNS